MLLGGACSQGVPGWGGSAPRVGYLVPGASDPRGVPGTWGGGSTPGGAHGGDPPGTATAAGVTHSTGMHSCLH